MNTSILLASALLSNHVEAITTRHVSVADSNPPVRIVTIGACRFQYRDYYNGYYEGDRTGYHFYIPNNDRGTRYSVGFSCSKVTKSSSHFPSDYFFVFDSVEFKWKSRYGMGKRYSPKRSPIGFYIQKFNSVNAEGIYVSKWGLLNGRPNGNFELDACLRHRELILCATGTVGDTVTMNGGRYVLKVLRSSKFLD